MATRAQIQRNPRPLGIALFAILALLALGRKLPGQGNHRPDALTEPGTPLRTDAPASPAIVIGFLGGFVRHDDPVHSVVQLAADLRREYPSGVDVETYENYRGEEAHKKILKLLDADHDGTLSAAEKQSARIILYGHSWGASQVAVVARELQKDNIPIRLTVQVDSVSKVGQNDSQIPANVAEAANFYQPDGLVRGETKIRAVDPSRTKILGNFRSDYKDRPYNCDKYPWYDRFLTRTHTQIECDPIVWKQVEALIRSALPPKPAS